MLCEALMHSPVLANEDGQPTVVPGMGSSSGYSPFDFDPDPELTLVSIDSVPGWYAHGYLYLPDPEDGMRLCSHFRSVII